ncbi:MAG: peptide-methionine (S)-S-oxide reductase MsrA [Acidobacteriia bacterium]|nr:peptide-methionine (S)-S-oxide reductase MsrA [Terriglobia bacterium]
MISTANNRIALRAGLFGMLATSMLAANLPNPAADEGRPEAKSETVVLAGGCFWGVQAVYSASKGVLSAVSGYAGGSKANAHYEIVSTGTTGHAESVQITFDPAQISFGQLLKIYFSVVHDPTELNRQGPDEGTQYRSEIFYTSEEQKRIAEGYIQQLGAAKVFSRPIVTKVAPLQAFYRAEDYHQDYVLHCQQNSPSCTNARYVAYNDVPKLASFKQSFPQLVKGAK